MNPDKSTKRIHVGKRLNKEKLSGQKQIQCDRQAQAAHSRIKSHKYVSLFSHSITKALVYISRKIQIKFESVS